MTARHRLSGTGLLIFGALLIACTTVRPTTDASGLAPASPDPSSSSSATPTATAEVDRAAAHLRVLSVDIGSRPAGSEAERKAAQYIAGVLTDQGYTAAVESFTFPSPFDESSVTIGNGSPLTARLLDGAALGTVTATLIDGGTGLPGSLEADVAGKIVLMRRGDIPFAQKVTNATQAGAVAVIVVNNERGPLRGTLGLKATIPALALDGGQWDALRAALGQPVTVAASGGTRTVTSQNVVGRRGSTCRAYIGSHYDSVPQGPGANDNASGTASMLEIARVRATDGLCAVAFGSEETGLFGSQAFVRTHVSNGSDGTQFMVNFDMMGSIDGPIVVGDDRLTGSILGILGSDPAQPLKAGKFPPFASSDHVSFTAAGIPAVTITSGDDDNIHTPNDRYDAVRLADLKTMLGLGDRAVAGLTRTLKRQ